MIGSGTPGRPHRHLARWLLVVLTGVMLAGTACGNVPTDPVETEKPDNPEDSGEPQG